MELWKPVPGWPWYEASSFGRVRTIDRVIEYATGRKQFYPAKVLKGKPNANGYLMVTMRRAGEDQGKATIHKLVALAFHGPRPAGLETRHLDGYKLNNRPDNLAYGTPSQNQRDIRLHGGKKSDRLSDDQVRQIKRAYETPYHGLGADLARKFGVEKAVVSHVKNGRTHREITP